MNQRTPQKNKYARNESENMSIKKEREREVKRWGKKMPQNIRHKKTSFTLPALFIFI